MILLKSNPFYSPETFLIIFFIVLGIVGIILAIFGVFGNLSDKNPSLGYSSRSIGGTLMSISIAHFLF